MKTDIRFPSRREDVRKIVIGLVEKLLGGQALESEIQAATEVVTNAFNQADYLAGNGIGGTATAQEGCWLAIASIDNGDFSLYKEVV